MNYLEGFMQHACPVNAVRTYSNNISPIQRRGGDSISFATKLDKLLDRNILLSESYSNPTIMRILKENSIPLNPNVQMFKDNVYQHSVDTKKAAIGIYNHLSDNLKQKANLRDIAEGAILHDIGKVLIPETILAKDGKLSDREREIMNLHSTFSDELLRRQNINDNVREIVKYHHQTPKGDGYPKIDNEIGIDAQIVSLADKYSALTEKRSYKPRMSDNAALEIIKNDVKNGGISDELYNALVSYIDAKRSKNAGVLSNYLGARMPQLAFSRMYIA